MSACTNETDGRLMHAYEVGRLPEEDVARFEEHCMTCPACFEEIQAFRGITNLLVNDPEIARLTTNATRADARPQSLRSRITEAMWPKTNLVLRPAVAYLAVALLIPLAYRGIKETTSGSSSVAPVQTVELLATRRSMPTLQPKPGAQVVLRFSFSGADPERTYRVALRTPGHETVYRDDRFRFGHNVVGYLSIPAAQMEVGVYQLVIEDPTDPTPLGRDTLFFEILN